MSNTLKYIAVVDDHAMFRKGLCMLVNLFPGYKVLFEAANGKEFVDNLKPNHLPDIVLMDIAMPEMDGYATTKWLNVNHPEVKVLALSTMDTETSIIKMIKCGAKGYVLKDADPNELKLAFSEVLAKGFYYNDLISKKIISSIHSIVDDSSALATLTNLSEREIQLIRLCCSEKTYQQIAAEMFLSEKTIDGYRDTLFRKLNVKTRVGLAMYAIKNGLVKL